MKSTLISSLVISGLLLACGPGETENSQEESGNSILTAMDKSKFEKTIDGKPVKLYACAIKNGMEMTVTNFGARVVELFAPDKNGNFEDVVLGYDNLEELHQSSWFLLRSSYRALW